MRPFGLFLAFRQTGTQKHNINFVLLTTVQPMKVQYCATVILPSCAVIGWNICWRTKFALCYWSPLSWNTRRKLNVLNFKLQYSMTSNNRNIFSVVHENNKIFTISKIICPHFVQASANIPMIRFKMIVVIITNSFTEIFFMIYSHCSEILNSEVVHILF